MRQKSTPALKAFRTSTALVASLSLMLPAGLPIAALAQDQPGLQCQDGTPVPCMPGQEPLNAEGNPVEGTTMSEAEQAARKAEAEAAAAAKAAEEAAAAEAAAAQKAAEEAAAAEAAAAQKAADEAAAAEAAAAQKAADEAAAAEAAAAQKAADEAAAAAEAEAQKAAEDAAAADAAAADAAAADAAAAEATAAAEAAKAAEEAATTEAEPAPEGAPETPETTETTVTEAPAEGAVSEEELAKELIEQLNETSEVIPELPVQPEAASGEAPVAAAAELPVEVTDDAAAPAPEAQVTEEVVTQEAVRTSAEDFANKVNQTAAEAATAAAAAKPAAQATAPAAEKKDKDRLSDLEKALLVGLGAVAVGAILSNNRKVELNSGDRVVVTRDDGSYQIIKDDDTLLRQPGSRVRTETFADGSTRTTVTREDGTRIVTIRDAEYRVLRRIHVDRAGQQTVLIDDTIDYEPVVISELPPPAPQPRITRTDDELALRLALEREARIGRRFSLAQIRDIEQVRALVPVIDLDVITFDTGSAAITPDQARALSTLGSVISGYITENPREVFLVEGHTDAVGGAAYNLALSDRRAESVALALTEYFGIPPENLVVQGYGEAFLKIDSQGDERANRRASVRRITDLLQQAAAQ